MANDEMRKVIEQLLHDFYPALVSKPDNSFVPSDCITKEFFEDLKTAFQTKKLSIFKRWEKYFAISCLKALSSHESYFRYVFFACELEVGHTNNIFDNLLSVCAIIIAYNVETLENTGLNFCDLSIDIFMKFYEKVLEEPFSWHGGFEEFARYLRNEYLAGKGYFEDDSQVPVTYRAYFEMSNNKSLKKVFEKIHLQPEYFQHRDVVCSLDSHMLTTEVINNIKLIQKKLPTLPRSSDLKTLLYVNRKRKASEASLKKTETLSKAKSTNSKREEVLLSANIQLPRLPGSDEPMGAIAANSQIKESRLEQRKTATVTDSKPKQSVKYSKFKPYTRHWKTKSPIKDSKLMKSKIDPKLETIKKELKSKPSHPDSKLQPPDIQTKPKSPATESKLKTFQTMETVLLPPSNSQTNLEVDQKANITWYENIVQAVIKFNRSNSSCPSKSDALLREVGEILERLRNSIMSLLELLD